MTLCSKVVHLVGSYLIEYLDDAQRIAQIGIVEMKVRMAFEMSDALAEVHRRPADCAMHIISFLQ